MEKRLLPADPYNLVITGVGGQGNVMASRTLARMLVKQGFRVTIGETFGMSQRGGSVMSHLRVSADRSWSPQIPRGRAHAVIALEPLEAIRVLRTFGNPQVKVFANTRAVYPVGVIAGELSYPGPEVLSALLASLSGAAWIIDATEEAVALGNPLLANIVMLGAYAEAGDLPAGRAVFAEVARETLGPDKAALNLRAFDCGASQMRARGPVSVPLRDP